MSEIYNTQTDLVFRISTGIDLTGITNVKLKYKDPKGVVELLDAVVYDAIEGILEYKFTEPRDAGLWVFWAYITRPGGDVSVGNAFLVRFKKEGTL